MKNNRILIIGPLPPPSGGVSIHIKRLSRLIGNDFEIDYIDESHTAKSDYFNFRSLNIFKYIQKIIHADLIYIHSGTSLQRVFHLMSGRIFSKKIILTLHAYPFIKNKIQKKIDEYFFNWADLIIFVNSDMLDNISLPKEKCLVKHAFLPPVIEMEKDLPTYVNDWIIKRKKTGRFVVCSNAVRLDVFNNLDLYGLDMCIQVAEILTNSRLPISFVFNVSSLEKNKDLYLKYHNRIKELNLGENFLLMNEELSFVNLIMQSDIVVRPTNTDGDALTVREALYLGKQVIASDIVPRPPGTSLFRSRDMLDFENKLREAIRFDSKLSVTPFNDQAEEYQNVYTELINKVLFT